MRDVTSDKAAIAIKESCLRAVEVPIPPEAVNALSTGSLASYEQAPALEGGAGLYIVLNNQSGYALTELTIAVQEKKNSTVQDRYTAEAVCAKFLCGSANGTNLPPGASLPPRAF
jgi:hypothetical protein